MAGWRETKILKPIDKDLLKGDHESPGRNNSERVVASKSLDLRAEPASGGRRQYGVPKSDRCGIPTSAGWGISPISLTVARHFGVRVTPVPKSVQTGSKD